MAERSHEVKGVKKTGKEREKYREREREGGRWGERVCFKTMVSL
jgi:hypothetical protein